MKATRTIDPGMLDNADNFSDPFYGRFTLRHADAPLKLNDTISKNYSFPTFYGDVTCAQAIFLCDYDAAQAMLPHPRLQPVPMTRGRSLVAFSCYEYKHVMGVAPYNEIAMTIPILVNPTIKVPVLPMIAGGLFSNFGYYVFSMPVTSLENQLRGLRIWNLPKVVHDIDIFSEGDDCVIVDYEEDGTEYLRLRVPRSGKPTAFDVKSYLYTEKEKRLLRSETNFKATFNVNKYMDQLLKKGAQPARPHLQIGDSPSGRMLKSLKIESHPFQFRYAEGMTACFDLPDTGYRAPIVFGGPEEKR
jgi:Acetoacetate decarboxylase (ADC)